MAALLLILVTPSRVDDLCDDLNCPATSECIIIENLEVDKWLAKEEPVCKAVCKCKVGYTYDSVNKECKYGKYAYLIK